MAWKTAALAPTHDLVIAHWALPSGLAAALGLEGFAAGPPLACWLHSADVSALERLPGGVALARGLSRRCRLLLAASQELARRFEALASLPAGAVRALHPGIEAGAAPAALPRGPLRLLYCGRLEPVKGAALLAEMARRRPGWSLRVLGGGGLLGGLRDASASLPNLQVDGPVAPAAVRRALDASHVLVLPGAQSGRSEGLPTAVLEALAAGRAVVAGASGGIPEVVGEAVGAAVPPGDTGALVAALDRLDRDRALLDACSHRARKRGLTHDARAAARRLLVALGALSPERRLAARSGALIAKHLGIPGDGRPEKRI